MLITFIVYAVLAGFMLALAWLSWSTPAFLFAGFVPLWIIASRLIGSGAKRSYGIMALVSYIAFLTWNVVDTLWLKNSTFAGFVAAAMANAAFVTVVMLASYFVVRRRGFVVGLVFWACAWIAFEKLHTEWELSWPLLTLGNGFAKYAGLVQWYEYTGVFGGSLWVLSANILLFFVWKAYDERRAKAVLYRRAGIAAAVIVLPMLVSWGIGAHVNVQGERVEAIALQPNIDPYGEKFSEETSDMGMARLMMEMCDTALTPATRLVAAPETYLPQYKPVERVGNLPVFDTLRDFSRRHGGLTVVTGSSFVRYFPDKASATPTANKHRYGDVWYDLYNSAVQITPDTFEQYEKSKLVPGVERFPYRRFLEGILGDIMIDMGGMTGSNVWQKEREVFVSDRGKMRLAPIICYESIYGEFVTDYVKKGANVLCIITNDGWWGYTEGHRQLLRTARLRAIETRLPIIRSANTGVSAFIAPDGTVISGLRYGRRGILKGELLLTEHAPTFYVRHGDYIARIAGVAMAALLLFSVVPFRRKK